MEAVARKVDLSQLLSHPLLAHNIHLNSNNNNNESENNNNSNIKSVSPKNENNNIQAKNNNNTSRTKNDIVVQKWPKTIVEESRVRAEPVPTQARPRPSSISRPEQDSSSLTVVFKSRSLSHVVQRHHQETILANEPIRRDSISSVGSTLRRTRRSREGDSRVDGLYNSELPSPRPNVLLPNFSISPYADSSRNQSWKDYE